LVKKEIGSQAVYKKLKPPGKTAAAVNGG